MSRRAAANLAVACLTAVLGLSGTARASDLPFTFDAGCSPGNRLRIAAVGDLLFHQTLQRQALAANGDYRRFWSPVQAILSQADMVYGNFEGPAADGVAAGGGAVRDPGRTLDGRVYGTTPGALVFNYHPSALQDLKASGFTIVSTANNHAADRGSLGIDRTIDNIRRAGLAFTGTRKRGENDEPWSAITRAKGFTVAWLACTYSTNGMPDRFGQALNCYSQREVVMGEIQRLAADPAIDAVILTPHWGQEYAHQPSPGDRRYARDAIEAGADAVLGAHPHVLQPWEQYRTASGREGLIVYSLGNFISNQQKPAQRSGVIALLELTKPSGEPRARLSAAGFVPTWVDFTPLGHRVTEMRAGPPAKGSPLAATLQLLPKDNRVTSATLANLPRSCPSDLVAAASAAADALPPQPESDTPPTARISSATTVASIQPSVLLSATMAIEGEGDAEPSRAPVMLGGLVTAGATLAHAIPMAIAGDPGRPAPLPAPDREPRRHALRLQDRPLGERAERPLPPLS